eukprot:1178893-Prorocentrum_minimum.AAC.4
MDYIGWPACDLLVARSPCAPHIISADSAPSALKMETTPNLMMDETTAHLMINNKHNNKHLTMPLFTAIMHY